MTTNSSDFVWNPVPESQTCTTQALTWSHQAGLTFGGLNISITDIGIEQQAPSMSYIASILSTTSTASLSLATSTSSIISRFRCAPGRRGRALGHTMCEARRLMGADDGYNGYGGSWLPFINQTLALDVNVGDSTWTWPLITVTEGWYVLVGTLTIDGNTLITTPPPFFVRNGTTSCFDAIPQSSSMITQTSSGPSVATHEPSSSSSVTPTSLGVAAATITVSSGAVIDSRVPAHVNIGAIVGGAVGGAILLMGTLVAVVRRRWLRSSISTPVISNPSLNANIPEPYDVTNEEFPTPRRATFLPLAGRPRYSVTKEPRQPLRHGPRVEVDRQPAESPSPSEGVRELQVQRGAERDQAAREMISMSVGEYETLLRRAGGVGAGVEHPEGLEDELSSVAPPEYQEVVCS